MIDTTLRGRLRWSWIKNAPDLWALISRAYPTFVFRDVDGIDGMIPVFTFHRVEPDSFEICCRHLAEGGYRALEIGEFFSILTGRARWPGRAVLLTFDDGGGSLWAVAYPLLKRYGLHATAFVVSGLVSTDARRRPNLEDARDGRAPWREVAEREQSDVPVCTWDELREMRSAGVVDVESHTHGHALVHVDDRLRDFLSPSFDPYHLGNFNVPVANGTNGDYPARPLVLGRPLYRAAPRMEGRLRFHDDPGLRRACERHVEARGGPAFFERRLWRRELKGVAAGYRARHGDRGRFENPEARNMALRKDLATSREVLESRLGEPTHHLCYPWHRGSDVALDVSRELGYRTNFWGLRRGGTVVRPGTDPYRIPRLDARYLLRLPGPYQRPLLRILSDHVRAVAGSDTRPVT